MTSVKARLRQAVYLVLRTGFRALPLSDGQRDRLRGRFLDKHADWVPPPPRGRVGTAADGQPYRPLQRADEPAIGHVPYRTKPLPETLPATLVAFYLPQFHPIAQNDAWWGKGFTEWRNVTRALPQFEGHVQPRLPADFGFYDLRNPQVMRDQAALAREYGIGAFCFYYYWFSGTTLLEAPLRQWLADDSIDFPFCLCWANENWARRWDGRSEDILIGQQHSAEDDIAFITHIADYLRDRRALKVDGKPMLLVYRPHLLPDARATGERWRQWCRDNGVGEIHLAYVQGFERPDPREIGFDAAVEFPPNMSNPRSLTADQYLINPAFEGDVRDWRELAAEIAARPLPEYPLYPGVNPGWDNEARRSGRGRVYLHASPRGYRDWLSTTIHQRLAPVPASQKLVFINAWNEWAEGAVLEPDVRLGHAYLEATREALLTPLKMAELRPCVVIHAGTAHALVAPLAALKRSQLGWRVVVVASPALREAIAERLAMSGVSADIQVRTAVDSEVSAGLAAADRLLREGEQLVLHLGAEDPAEALLDDKNARSVLSSFVGDPLLGMVTCGTPDALAAAPELEPLLTQIGLRTDAPCSPPNTGCTFWVRLAALRPILDAHLTPSQVSADQDAVSRVLAAAVAHTGHTVTGNQVDTRRKGHDRWS